MTDLGTLGGYSSAAYAINDSGQIVGSANRATGSYHAFLYSNGTMSDLGALGGALYDCSEAYAINGSGQAAGYSGTATGAVHAFLYGNGT
jgi:probable HAF family extracellular repeat protein